MWDFLSNWRTSLINSVYTCPIPRTCSRVWYSGRLIPNSSSWYLEAVRSLLPALGMLVILRWLMNPYTETFWWIFETIKGHRPPLRNTGIYWEAREIQANYKNNTIYQYKFNTNESTWYFCHLWGFNIYVKQCPTGMEGKENVHYGRSSQLVCYHALGFGNTMVRIWTHAKAVYIRFRSRHCCFIESCNTGCNYTRSLYI